MTPQLIKCFKKLGEKKSIGSVLTQNFLSHKASVLNILIPMCRVAHDENVRQKSVENIDSIKRYQLLTLVKIKTIRGHHELAAINGSQLYSL